MVDKISVDSGVASKQTTVKETLVYANSSQYSFLVREFCAVFPVTLNISRSESFLTSNLSNGCFSLMIDLHIFSRADNSVLDTTLKNKEEILSFSTIFLLGPVPFTTN